MKNFTFQGFSSFSKDHKVTCTVAVSAVLLWFTMGGRIKRELISAMPAQEVTAIEMLSNEFPDTTNFTMVESGSGKTSYNDQVIYCICPGIESENCLVLNVAENPSLNSLCSLASQRSVRSRSQVA